MVRTAVNHKMSITVDGLREQPFRKIGGVDEMFTSSGVQEIITFSNQFLAEQPQKEQLQTMSCSECGKDVLSKMGDATGVGGFASSMSIKHALEDPAMENDSSLLKWIKETFADEDHVSVGYGDASVKPNDLVTRRHLVGGNRAARVNWVSPRNGSSGRYFVTVERPSPTVIQKARGDSLA